VQNRRGELRAALRRPIARLRDVAVFGILDAPRDALHALRALCGPHGTAAMARPMAGEQAKGKT